MSERRFKGVKVVREGVAWVEVIPLYHAKRGGTIAARGMTCRAESVDGAMGELVPVLLGRKDLKG